MGEHKAMYRSTGEIEHWETMHSPITRLRKLVERKCWWRKKEESQLHIGPTKPGKSQTFFNNTCLVHY